MSVNVSSSSYILSTSREYSIYVNNFRAIPFVPDGLKDGQRKALWLMRNQSGLKKTIALAGEMAGEKLYVHGDASAQDSISKLAAPYINNIPLLQGHGQFGSRIAPVEGIGAARYTDVGRSKGAEAFLYNDIDIVPLEDNYDMSTKQPIHFLPLIPVVLLNGVSGVGVGWSTDILPRKFKELVQATQDALNDRPIKKLTPYFERYSVGVNHLINNTWEISGRVEIIDASTIRIVEIPKDLTMENLQKRLNTYEEEDKIQSFKNDSTDTINVLVKFKRGSIKDWTEDYAIDFFKLRQKSTERIVVISWDRDNIVQYDTAEQLVKDFAVWRLKWYTKRYERFLALDTYELNYWLALDACFKAKFPTKLNGFANKQEVEAEVNKITMKVNLDSYQLDKIVSLPSYKWAKDFYQDVLNKIQQLKDNIKEYNDILSKPDRLKKIYNDELEDLKKLKC